MTNEFRGQLTTVEAIREYALAGKARITLRSRKSAKHFTYRLATKRGQEDSPWFVSVLRGTDNESDYEFIGTIFRNEEGQSEYMHSQKAWVKADAPSVRAFAWFWHKITLAEMPPDLDVWHEGRCGRCGRTLTVPESIARGIGPECAGAMAAMASLDLLLNEEETEDETE